MFHCSCYWCRGVGACEPCDAIRYGLGDSLCAIALSIHKDGSLAVEAVIAPSTQTGKGWMGGEHVRKGGGDHVQQRMPPPPGQKRIRPTCNVFWLFFHNGFGFGVGGWSLCRMKS